MRCGASGIGAAGFGIRREVGEGMRLGVYG
jgi:hypothetical protein